MFSDPSARIVQALDVKVLSLPVFVLLYQYSLSTTFVPVKHVN